MGIAVLTIADLLSPLQALAHRWMTPRRSPLSSNLRYVAIRPACAARAGAEEKSPPQAHAARPLRVIRVVDPRSTHSASRVVISGRMDDVCAELDRLAALEAHSLHPVASRMH
ncbi:hypothetical protein [Variovorax sp. OV329]|uniref:hypothetical protein n=1 Tax=Variovorax sp. OV329 TaxID=1882825 RepID=UPI0008EB7317|nr:hypothetical protein [Variovorax sp. OV329]SFM44647.1 hypothetical protein SAMN05444747_105244 [Variovorax sp. OV329]